MPPKGKKGKKAESKRSPTGKGQKGKTRQSPQTEEPEDQTGCDEITEVTYNPPPYEPTNTLHFSQMLNIPQYFEMKDTYFSDSQWYWSPRSITFTNDGELWLSDPPRHRIVRYKYDNELKFQRLDDLNTACECYKLKCHHKKGVIGLAKHEEKQGFIKFFYEYIDNIGTTKLQINRIWRETQLPEDIEDEGNKRKSDGKRKDKEKKKSPRQKSPASKRKSSGSPKKGSPKEQEPPEKEIFNTPEGILDLVPDEDNLLYVSYQPEYKLEILSYETLEKVESYIRSPEEKLIDFKSDGGLVAMKNTVYIMANNPPRIMIFHVKKECVYDVIDRITLIHVRSVGQFHLLSPHSIACDWLGNILVSDQLHHCIRVFNRVGHYLGEIGGKTPLKPYKPGHLAVSKNGIIAFIEHASNHSLVLMNAFKLKFYHETILVFNKHLIKF